MAWLDIKGRDINDAPGGSAAQQVSNTFGAITFADGPFQVGGAGNLAYQPESISAPTTPQGYRSPADLSYGLLGASSAGSSSWLLIIAGLGLVAFYFLRHR